MSGSSTSDIIILCGGQGQRLRSEIGETQKVMAQVDQRPFLDIILNHVQQQGFRRIVLCTGYKSEDVEQYYQTNNFGLDIVFSKEKKPLGTGGAVKNARPHIKTNPFFVLNGDSFCPVNFDQLLDFHLSRKAQATIAVSKVKDGRDYGTILLDAQKKISKFLEKQDDAPGAESIYVNAGVYCLNEECFSLMPGENKFSIETQFFPSLTGKEFYGFEVKEKFIDIGTPQRLNNAKQSLQ